MTDVLKLCERLRARLIDESLPFYAMIAYNLEHLSDTSGKTETMSTDGTRIWINPEFFESLLPQEQAFCYAHELMHCALQHMYRCEGRDMELWNIATDMVINATLTKDKIGQAPEGVIECPPGYLNKTGDPFPAESIYAKLAELPDGEVSKYKGNKPTGSFSEAPEEDEDKTPADWEVAIEIADMVAAKEMKESGGRGGPGGEGATARVILQSRESRTDWISRLWQFAEKHIPSESTWSIPNRRYLAHNLYFPSMRKSNMPKLGLGIDTSGSISSEYLEAVQFQAQAIHTQLKPREIEIVYCNSVIQGTEKFGQDSELTLNAKGGGGTHDMDFWPIIDYFNAEEDDKPAAVVIFTDLAGLVPPEPEYPVMWLVPEWSSQPDPPYGETVRISLYS